MSSIFKQSIPIVSRIILLFTGVLIAHSSLADDVSDLHWLLDDTNRWSLGASYRVETSPYQDESTLDDLLPLIIYSGERFYLAGTSLGAHVVENEKWEIDAFASYRFGGFNEENSDFLDGMDRDDSVDFGMSFIRRT